MAANAEEFLLKLTEQISGPASIAASSLSKLERQIRAEETALHGMEDSLRAAKSRLGDLQQGFGGKVDISAVTKARAEIEKLQEKIQNGKDNLDTLAGSRGAIGKAAAEADAAKQAQIQSKAQAQAEKAAKVEAAAKARIVEKSAADAAKIGKTEADEKAKLAAKVAADAAKAAKVGKAGAAKTSTGAGGAAKIKAAGGAAKEASVSFRQLGAAAGETDGPLGNAVRAIGKFKAAGAAGAILAVVGVLILITTAAIGAAVALTQFALASADASRASALMSNAAAGGSATGAELEAVINDIANKTPLARDKIAEMGRAMELAHLQGRNMQNALEATATATAAVGASAGAAFTSIAENSQKARRFLLSRNDLTGLSAELEGTGVAFADVAAALARAQGTSVEAAALLIKRGQVSVKDGLEAMNAAVQQKFGKTVAAQMLSLNNQFAKMKEGLGRLFDGVDIEPFLRGLQTITGLFSEQTVTGAALKTLFVSMFGGLASASEGVFPIISAFLRGMVLACLDAYIGFLRVRKALVEAFGGDSASKIDWVNVAMWAGYVAVIGIGGAIAGLVGGLALLAVVMLPLAIVLSLPFILAAAAIYGLIAAFDWITGPLNDTLIGGFQSAAAYLRGLDFAAIGKSLVDGLVNGIKAGATFVIDAVKSLGTSAMTTLKSTLGIHSPSTVFMGYGVNTAEGYGKGVEAGTPDANEKVQGLGSEAPTSSPRASTERPSVTNNFYFTGSRSDFEEFRRMQMDFWEEMLRGGPDQVPT